MTSTVRCSVVEQLAHVLALGGSENLVRGQSAALAGRLVLKIVAHRAAGPNPSRGRAWTRLNYFSSSALLPSLLMMDIVCGSYPSPKGRPDPKSQFAAPPAVGPSAEEDSTSVPVGPCLAARRAACLA